MLKSSQQDESQHLSHRNLKISHIPVRHKIKTRHKRSINYLSWSGPEKRTFILLHGFPDTGMIWQRLAPYLQKKGRVIAFDLPIPTKSDRFLSVGLDLTLALNQLLSKKTSNVILIGHDIGSIYAWWLAGHLAGELELLVTINGSHPEDFIKLLQRPRQWMKSWYMPLMLVPGLRELAIKYLGKQIFHFYNRTDDTDPLSLENAAGQSRHYEMIFKHLISDGDFTPKIRNIMKKYLLIQASDDPFLTSEIIAQARFLSQKISVRKLTGGHWLQLTAPEVLSRFIIKELSRDRKKNKTC